MSKSFKGVLTIRFLGYFIFFIGILGLFFMLGPFFKAEISFRVDRMLGVKREAMDPSTLRQRRIAQDDKGRYEATSSFASLKAQENLIIPVSTEYGIVIEKINANARIIPNVNPVNEKEYVQALQKGVAEAAGSSPPGVAGNLYLFSHSTDAPWNIIRFNAIFYLLRELQIGDRVIIFYKDKRYDYIVFDKAITPGNDVSFLTNKYDVPVLTLQTCDPPGTLFKRLVVRAKLVSS